MVIGLNLNVNHLFSVYLSLLFGVKESYGSIIVSTIMVAIINPNRYHSNTVIIFLNSTKE